MIFFTERDYLTQVHSFRVKNAIGCFDSDNPIGRSTSTIYVLARCIVIACSLPGVIHWNPSLGFIGDMLWSYPLVIACLPFLFHDIIVGKHSGWLAISPSVRSPYLID